MSEFKELVGKVVTSVEVSDDKQVIRFNLMDDKPVIYCADGDCCSHSWFESIQGLDNLLYNMVLDVETKEEKIPDSPSKYGDDEVTVAYGYTIKTKDGYFDIEMRNSSNGYYGGSVEKINSSTCKTTKLEKDY